MGNNMITNDTNEIPQEVLSGVLQVLNIDISGFMQRLANDDPKEVLLYAKIWAIYDAANRYDF